jgi:sulfur carrier protein
MGAEVRPEALRPGEDAVTGTESLLVNGVPRNMAAGTTVDDVVTLIAPDKRGVAVAVNGEVVPKSAWLDTTVGAGDTVEVLTAAQGG